MKLQRPQTYLDVDHCHFQASAQDTRGKFTNIISYEIEFATVYNTFSYEHLLTYSILVSTLQSQSNVSYRNTLEPNPVHNSEYLSDN